MPKYDRVNEAVAGLSREPVVEKLARVLDPIGDELEDHRQLYDVLTGDSLTGHPIHPALVHFPIGITVGNAALEVVGGGRFRAASTILSGITVAVALPTAVTGLAEWTRGRLEPRQRRVGVLHAVAAATGSALSVTSFVLRLMKHHGAARMFLFAAVAGYGTAGFLGADLVYGRDLVPGADGESD